MAKGGRAGEEAMVEIDEALRDIVRPGIGDWTLDQLEALRDYIQESLRLGAGQERRTF